MAWKQSKYLVLGGVACLAGAWRAFQGIRASPEKRREMAETIGTKSPRFARAVCWIAFVPLLLAGIGFFVLAGFVAAGAFE